MENKLCWPFIVLGSYLWVLRKTGGELSDEIMRLKWVFVFSQKQKQIKKKSTQLSLQQ